MKQEVIRTDNQNCRLYTAQTLVVGSGAAGLNAAISLYKEGVRDLALLTEGRDMGTSRNTGSDKQTYYKLTVCSGESDSVGQMAKTLFDGGAVDGDTALAEAALSARGFFRLVDLGVPFPHNGSGEYIGYKTDHDPFRRGTSAGPLTSRYMTEALWEELERYPIPVYDGFQVIEVLTDGAEENRQVRGVMALDKRALAPEQMYCIFLAENVVYAVGGEAGLYGASVYPVSQIGGMGTALRAGAKGKNLTESQFGIASIKFRWNLSGTYQQVLPRYISTAQDGTDQREFLDESFDSPFHMLYAIFLKGYQWPFDPRKAGGCGSSLIDLLVYQETAIKGRRVFLDYRNNPSCCQKEGRFQTELLHQEAREYLEKSGGIWDTPIERLEHMNPAAIELYRSHGIDLHEDLLEIAVCAQHGNGGLAGNAWWESNLRHFFPVGEVNGSHGIYRPGGSALNAGQVGGMRAAEYIARCCREEPISAEEFMERCKGQAEAAIGFGTEALKRPGNLLDLKKEDFELKARMSKYGAHVRSLDGVRWALSENRRQRQRLMEGRVAGWKDLRAYYRLRDLLVSQQAYLEAIEDYIQAGGKSRGSYLVYDSQGELPAEGLLECFRSTLDGDAHKDMIQELSYQEEGSKIRWRRVRPIPKEDCWFEAVWKKYREGVYFEESV